MPKVSTWADNALYAALLERCEEEGVTRNAVVAEALRNHLMLTDSKPKRKDDPDLGALVQKSLGLPFSWWNLLGIATDEEGYKSINHWFRELVREKLGLPVPAKVVRAPRDHDLSWAMKTEAQADMYDGMRNLRTSPKEKELTPLEWVDEHPSTAYQVCECFVDGCNLHLVGMHQHNTDQLGNWKRYQRGEILLDRRTGKWREADEG